MRTAEIDVVFEAVKDISRLRKISLMQLSGAWT